jgi:hypothetical protein
MFSRRHLLVVATATVVGTAGLGAWRYLYGTDESAIIAVLRKRLHYLQLDEQGLLAYAKDLVAAGIVSSGKLRLLDAARPVYTHLVPTRLSALTRELNHGEERIVSQYLLSSDFFQNGNDEKRLVRYRQYYDPIGQIGPCSNPFSRPNA